MLDLSLLKHECGIHLLASPEPHTDYRQIRPELIQKVVQLSRSAFPTVVADLEDCDHLDQVRTLAASDQIIMVMRPDFVSLVRAKKLVSYLLSAGVAREHLTLVVSRTGQPKELPIAQAEEVLGVSIGHRVPDDPATVNESINLGIPLAVSCPHSKAATAVTRLADSLLGVTVEPRPASWVNRQLQPLKSVACLLGVAST
jgi:pilus assembly protein CpaE